MNKLILMLLITLVSKNGLTDEKNQNLGKVAEDGLVTGMNAGINAIGRVFKDQVLSPLDKVLTKPEHISICRDKKTDNCKRNYIQRIK